MRFTAVLLYTLLIFMKEIHVATTDVILETDKCLKRYFYNGIPPTYFNNREGVLNDGDKFICQKWNGTSYFLSRYSTQLKIPIYSAYKIKSLQKNCTEKGSWKIDNTLDALQQASLDDYNGSGYDRGHLNPRCHNMYSKERIKATYTLTNAVPMNSSVNKIWYRFAELPLFNSMAADQECASDNAKRYVITGVIPGNEWMREEVNIPEYVWTAALCVNSNSFVSFGYWMKTNFVAENGSHISIHQLEDKLKTLTPGRSVQLFHQLRSKRPRESCRA